MKFFKKLTFSFVAMLLLLIPQQALAITPTQTEQCNELKQQFQNANGGDLISGLPEYCSIGSVYTKFLNYAMYAVGIAAVIAIIYGGYLYMTAGAYDVQRKKGRTVLTWAIIGLIVVVLAAVIVNVVIRAVVENRFV